MARKHFHHYHYCDFRLMIQKTPDRIPLPRRQIAIYFCNFSLFLVPGTRAFGVKSLLLET